MSPATEFTLHKGIVLGMYQAFPKSLLNEQIGVGPKPRGAESSGQTGWREQVCGSSTANLQAPREVTVHHCLIAYAERNLAMGQGRAWCQEGYQAERERDAAGRMT